MHGGPAPPGTRYGDGKDHESDDRRTQQRLLQRTERLNGFIPEDRVDPLAYRGGVDARDTDDRGHQVAPADVQYRLSVKVWFIDRAHQVFVAGSLALVDQPPAGPPHQWVKPEGGLDEHVDRASEIVTPPDMTQLVGHDRRELPLGQVTVDACLAYRARG